MGRILVLSCALALALGFTGSAQAQLPEGMVLDHAFTYFSIENNSAAVNGRQTDQGWSLKSDFRVFGVTGGRSALKFVVKKGNRTLGESTCEVALDDQSRPMSEGPPSFYVINCRNREQRISETGDLTVEVHFIDDDNGRTTLLDTARILVRTVTRVRGNGDADAPHHYVDRNGEALTATLHLQNNRSSPYFRRLNSRGGTNGGNSVTLTVNLSTDEQHRAISSSTNLRCSVNGQRVPMEHDQVTGRQLRMIYMVQSWGQGRREETESVEFRQFVLHLPLSFDTTVAEQTHPRWYPDNQRNSRLGYLNEHPGTWECDWRDGQTVLRTWRWTIGEDGRVVPHAEQAAGLTHGPNAFFVETVIPAGGSGYDIRLHRDSVTQRAFAGRGWQTDAGRALARTVPNVGQPAAAARGGRAAPARARARGR